MALHENTWERLGEIFERMLASDDPAAVLAAEPDPELRRQAAELWAHHVSAGAEGFLRDALEFTARPVYQPGQLLANRFCIERLLGRGGMGEVYLALDERMNEHVALKTIARLLAPSPALRRRIVAEVQNARRVTHPHVCRIHELFDDGDSLFFTMERLEGSLLSDHLSPPPERSVAREIVRQLAEGLRAAHRTGVVHGDFKPSNVMLAEGATTRAVIMDFGLARAFGPEPASAERVLSWRAGTAEYMAPELRSGGAPDVRSDIYAFGKVAETLLPGHRLWAECLQENPLKRPASLDAILRRLSPGSARRYFLAGGAVAATGAISYALGGREPRQIPASARLLVNGFRAAGDQLSAARVARGLMITALSQSPRLRTISDLDLLPAVRAAGAALPLAGATLFALLTQLRAAFWVDADLGIAAGRAFLRLRVFRAADRQAMAEASFADQPSASEAAQAAARWLRQRAGESARSLAANPAAALSYTSQVPEALQKYFDAMEYVSVGRMQDALPLLEESVRLDPEFAQARSALGLALNPLLRHEEAYEDLAAARKLAARLPERERARIENDYAKVVDDPDAMVDAARRHRDYYPDEARSYRALGWALARSGAPEEAVEQSRKAVEMSPSQDLYRMELIKHLVEAARFEEAFNEYESSRRDGPRNPWIFSAGGLACLALGRYQEAVAAYEGEPVDLSPVYRSIDVQRARVLLGELEPAISELEQLRGATAGKRGETRVVLESLVPLYFLTDRSGLARSRARELADLPAYPQYLRTLQCAAFWSARVVDPSTLSDLGARIREVRGRWPHRRSRSIELHAAALEARQAGDLANARDLLLQSQGLAFSVWTLFDLADVYTSLAQPGVAVERWREFDRARGVVLSQASPALLVWSWLRHAIAADAASDRAGAREFARKVLDHWSRSNPRLRIVQLAASFDRL